MESLKTSVAMCPYTRGLSWHVSTYEISKSTHFRWISDFGFHNLDFKVNFWILFESLIFVILKIQLKYTYEQSMNHSADQHLAINSPASLGPINHSADLFQYCTRGTHTDNFRVTTFEWVLEVLLASSVVNTIQQERS